MIPQRLIIILTALALLILGAGYAVVYIADAKKTAQINFSVVPSPATIKIDGQGSATEGIIKVTPGTHTLTASYPGFASSSISITVQSGQTVTQHLSLAANSDEGRQYLTANPDDVAKAEGYAGSKLNSNGEVLTKNNPILTQLPYTGSSYSIGFGKSVAHPDVPASFALYITAGDKTSQTKALNWIKSQGYDPANFEIIYLAPQS